MLETSSCTPLVTPGVGSQFEIEVWHLSDEAIYRTSLFELRLQITQQLIYMGTDFTTRNAADDMHITVFIVMIMVCPLSVFIEYVLINTR